MDENEDVNVNTMVVAIIRCFCVYYNGLKLFDGLLTGRIFYDFRIAIRRPTGRSWYGRVFTARCDLIIRPKVFRALFARE